jgi:hypothetical protein
MLAQRVDLADGRARGQQQLMEGDGVVERDLRVQGRSNMAEPPPEMRKKISVSFGPS